jgi:hypothetical protein
MDDSSIVHIYGVTDVCLNSILNARVLHAAIWKGVVLCCKADVENSIEGWELSVLVCVLAFF